MTVHDERALTDANRTLDAWQQNTDDAARQRRYTRFPACGQAHLQPEDATSHRADAPIGRIRNLSRGGLCVLCDKTATIGDRWRIDLAVGRLSIATVSGVCRYCREVTAGMHVLGIEFGVDAALLLAMGVPASQLARRLDTDFECPPAAPRTGASSPIGT